MARTENLKLVRVAGGSVRSVRRRDIDTEEINMRKFDVSGVKAQLLSVDVRDWKPAEVFYVGRAYRENPKYGAGGSAWRAGSVLNNPFSLWDSKAKQLDETKRGRSVELYQHWLKQYVLIPGLSATPEGHSFTAGEIRDRQFYPFKFTADDCIAAWNELIRLAGILKSGSTVRLACWCKRKGSSTACHGDTVAEAVRWLVEKGHV